MIEDRARRYHEATKHSPESVRRGARALDWKNKPLPFKLYPHLDPLYLPRDLPETAGSARALSGDPEELPVDILQLARLLFYTAGVTRQAGGHFFRAAPSAGALYPVEVYVVAGRVKGLDPGVYHFNPIDFALRRLRGGDLRSALAEAVADQDVARLAVSLVFTGIPWRTTWKYGERGYRHLFWDAGTMLGNLLSLEGSTRVLAGFVDSAVGRLLGLTALPELPLLVAPLGSEPDGADPSPVTDLDPPRHEVVALSSRSVEYPLLDEVHRAGDLEDEAAVAGWRERAAGQEWYPSLTGLLNPPAGPIHPADSIERVILRRGSTRRFRRRWVTEGAARWILQVAQRSLPADFVSSEGSLLEPFVAVHAIEGVAPGAYRAGSGALEQIHSSVSRDETAHLCLDQPLGGDAAFTVFFGAPLDRILDVCGARGYRAAQLEAGIATERLHLAAYSVGLGCTGLTFYDDEVRRFFRTESEPMLVAAVGEPAYRAGSGRPPAEQPSLRLVLPDG